MKLLLDLDGTLTDLKPGISRSIEYALVKLGLPVPSEEEFVNLIGQPMKKIFSELLPDPTDDDINNATALYSERFADEGIYENSVYPGIKESLENFHEMGVGLYLATSKPHTYAARILEHFKMDHLFRGVHGSEMDGTRQDKTELISYVLETEGITPRHATMVGDRAHDIKAGLANNIQTVGVLWGYGTKDELISAGADLVVDRPADLDWLLEYYEG
ncbi:MAG: HAD family hydrolase [Gammaproteobacteria bacterium]|nr:HAD family hydrolase [Gammaproteobacteria bacterium]